MRKPMNVQKPRVYGICPLCEKAFRRAQLRVRIQAEPPKTRRQIIKAIRDEYPLWVQEDGACQHCWESFCGVVRVVNFMKEFRFPRGWCRPKGRGGKAR